MKNCKDSFQYTYRNNTHNCSFVQFVRLLMICQFFAILNWHYKDWTRTNRVFSRWIFSHSIIVYHWHVPLFVAFTMTAAIEISPLSSGDSTSSVVQFRQCWGASSSNTSWEIQMIPENRDGSRGDNDATGPHATTRFSRNDDKVMHDTEYISFLQNQWSRTIFVWTTRKL